MMQVEYVIAATQEELWQFLKATGELFESASIFNLDRDSYGGMIHFSSITPEGVEEFFGRTEAA
jgi:hypothetical protein